VPEQRELVCGADGRVGEVMARTTTTRGNVVWLRFRGSSYEIDVPADSVTPCDADGNPLPAAQP
jgi:hypothetical protein